MPTDNELEAFRSLKKTQDLITDRLDQIIELAKAYETAFRLIEVDPHTWSSRPCQTCTAVSLLIGRSFGCTAKQ